ncbi:iron-containing redox enzyme family protein [Geodermatophilus marinus]|uniref:iron-containing redox enzyme family protein n=1 Tax=Geodermatophilus sp. LHW52908 TaxID=2303986 RepID=UPI000E3EC146|nr:iron-containing redox enzyme family protein [Geodermatophilus sp. LHW52908]RFU22707.1 iron-containing redox enzyme family protein [Geodermatophilus sp. LHW52908]
MQLPEPRGPLSAALATDLRERSAVDPATAELAARAVDGIAAAAADPLLDEDLQLSLAVCYELHYRGFDDVDPAWEWEPSLLALRARLEAAHLAGLRALVGEPPAGEGPVDSRLADLVAADDGPSLSRYLARDGSREQWREYLTLRSVYHLKEGDPHSFAIPRLEGRAKSAMVEIQADEYGGGSAARMHSTLFAGMLHDLDLPDAYGALWDAAPAPAFASVNTMSLFGLHRRWRGAAVGHLTAVEMTSSEPSRRYSAGLRRLGFGEGTRVFYDEHVEADAVHEQIAAVDMCGSLVTGDPALADDVLFGAACALALDGLTARYLLDRWEDGGSALRRPGQPGTAASRSRPARVIAQPKTVAAGNMSTL